jgi:hypothetical protein
VLAPFRDYADQVDYTLCKVLLVPPKSLMVDPLGTPICPEPMVVWVQVDAELWNGNIASRPDRNHLLALGGRLVSRMPKLRPIVYASAGQYGNSLMGLPWPLWNARYPSNVALGFKQVYALLGGEGNPDGAHQSDGEHSAAKPLPGRQRGQPR